MGWILLAAFQFGAIAIFVDDVDTCLLLKKLNELHWLEQKIEAKAVCMKSFEI